jgi:hypothetical protein
MFLLWPFRRNRFQWEHTSVLGLGDPEFWAATKATGISCQPLPTVGLLTEAATLQATPRRLIQPRLDGWSTNHNIQPFDSCNPSFALPYPPPFLFCLVCSEYVAIYFNVVGYWRLPRGCKFCCWGEARGWTEGAPSFSWAYMRINWRPWKAKLTGRALRFWLVRYNPVCCTGFPSKNMHDSGDSQNLKTFTMNSVVWKAGCAPASFETVLMLISTIYCSGVCWIARFWLSEM